MSTSPTFRTQFYRRFERQQLLAQQSRYDMDFKDVKGQYQAKRAMEVAVAGAHNIVLLCPPEVLIRAEARPLDQSISATND